MKPWVIWAAALTGIVISLTLRAFVDRGTLAAPPPPQHAEVATSNWDRRIAWATSLSQTVNVMPGIDELKRIIEEKPLLFLETGRGERVVVGAYQVEGEWLMLSDIRDLEPVPYVHLIAVYSDRREWVMPVDLDLRIQP